MHSDKNTNDTKTRLNKDLIEELLNHSENLASRYGGLNIEYLLGHMASNKSPSRKEIVALASAAQNHVRAIDKGLLKSYLSSRASIEAVALGEIRRALVDPTERSIRLVWGRDYTARARRLVAILEAAGFAQSGELPRLGDNFIDTLARSSLSEVSHRLEVR